MKKAYLFFLVLISIPCVFAQNPQPSPSVKPSPIPPQGFDFTQYGVRIEPDRRLIVVMAALEAAGLETKLSNQGEEFRKQLKADLSSLNETTRQKLQTFLAQYKRRHPNETPAQIAAPFVSLAYALSPVPDLQDPPRTADLPANLLEIFDFAPLVREFYRQSNFGANLDNYLKIYQAEGDKLRPSAALMVRGLLDYLHTRPQTSYVERIKVEAKNAKGKNSVQKIETRDRERRFYIVPDLLAPAGTINFRNVGDDYYVVVPPNTNLTSSEARRAFLQFVLDPLILQNAKDINGFRDGIKSLIEERRKTNPDIPTDIFLAVSRSLVAAVDAKQIAFQKYKTATLAARQNPNQNRSKEIVNGKEAYKISDGLYLIDGKFVMPEVDDAAALELSEAYESGAVLSFFFAEQLKGIEESGFDISGAFRDMILSFDATKETNRLAQFAEAGKRARAARAERRKNAAQMVAVELSPREKALMQKLQQIEDAIKTKEKKYEKYEKAEAELAALMNEYPGDARIFFARGRVASLSAEDVFDESMRDERLGRAAANYRFAIQNANPETDKVLLARAHVALGRILEFNDQKEAAIREYDAVIKLGEVDKQAFQEASARKAELEKKP